MELQCDGSIYVNLTVEIKGPFKVQPFVWNKKAFEISAKQEISQLKEFILTELNKELLKHLDESG